jgi:hypothetical protein
VIELLKSLLVIESAGKDELLVIDDLIFDIFGRA